MKQPFLTGQKVYLRPLEPVDAELFVDWVNDSEVIRTLQMWRPRSESEERAWIERTNSSDHDVVLGIALKRDDRLVGATGLHAIDWRNGHSVFGIVVGDKAAWGKGYGTEATALIVGYGFETLNLNRVWLQVYDFNPRGIRAYERVGFRREGTLRKACYREGSYHDVHVMGILREEWDALKRRSRGGPWWLSAAKSAAPARSRR